MDLGPLVGTFFVDVERRRRLAWGLSVSGVLLTPIAVVCTGIGFSGASTTGPGMIPALMLGASLGMLVCGVWLSWVAITRRGERFELHKGGIVHVYSGRRREVPWAQMKAVKVQDRAGPWAGFLGMERYCRISVHDGKALSFTSQVDDFNGLSDAIRQAVEHGVHPAP